MEASPTSRPSDKHALLGKATNYGAAASARGAALMNRARSAPWWDDTMVWLKPLAVIALYLFVGVAWFVFWEGWTLSTAFYFCVVTATTVGYGDFYPLDNASKIFVVLYVITAISLIAALISNLLEELIERQALAIASMVRGQTVEDDPQSHMDNIMRSLGGLLAIAVVGIAFFMLSQKLSFVDAIYLTTISSSTVGYGDLSIKPKAGAEIFMGVWLLFSTVALARVIGDFSSAYAFQKEKEKINQVLRSSLATQSDFAVFDKDRDGLVTRDEYVIEVLLRTEKVTQQDVDTIMSRFDQLDKDDDGNVTLSEVIGA